MIVDISDVISSFESVGEIWVVVCVCVCLPVVLVHYVGFTLVQMSRNVA